MLLKLNHLRMCTLRLYPLTVVWVVRVNNNSDSSMAKVLWASQFFSALFKEFFLLIISKGLHAINTSCTNSGRRSLTASEMSVSALLETFCLYPICLHGCCPGEKFEIVITYSGTIWDPITFWLISALREWWPAKPNGWIECIAGRSWWPCFGWWSGWTSNSSIPSPGLSGFKSFSLLLAFYFFFPYKLDTH